MQKWSKEVWRGWPWKIACLECYWWLILSFHQHHDERTLESIKWLFIQYLPLNQKCIPKYEIWSPTSLWMKIVQKSSFHAVMSR
jgi:hypothetical protein